MTITRAKRCNYGMCKARISFSVKELHFSHHVTIYPGGVFFPCLHVPAARAITVPRRLALEQKRFRGKINIQRPQKLFYERALVTEFVTPFYLEEKEPEPLWNKCLKANKKKIIKEPHPYQLILARECLQRFNASKMIVFLHKNSMTDEMEFDLAVELKKAGDMKLKFYGPSIIRAALKDTQYEAVIPLFNTPTLIVLSPEPNSEAVRKIVKKTPQVSILAGILNDTLLSANDFLKYGNMDITEARSQLVHILQTAGGINLNRQLTHHQSTLVSRLKLIGKNDEGVAQANEDDSQEAKNKEPE